jgi:hypothetical protein
MKKNNFLVVATFLAITSCAGDVQETLGMRRDAPDEFAVEKRPKLDVPPEFKLRPPSTDGSNLRESRIRDELKNDIFTTPSTTEIGSAEAILLQKTQADSATPEIRNILSNEYGVDPSLLERIESISDDSNNQTLVDAEKERERINANKQQGKPISEGEVETRSSTGSFSVLQKIMGE